MQQEFVLSELQQNAAGGLAGSALQSQCIKLELALIAASIGGIGLVVDDSPGYAIGPGEIDAAFDDGALLQFDDHWHLPKNLPAGRLRHQRMIERDTSNLFGCAHLVGSCVPPPAMRGRAAAGLEHGVNELAKAASVQGGMEVDPDDFHRDCSSLRDQGGFAGEPLGLRRSYPGARRRLRYGSPRVVSRILNDGVLPDTIA
jgi:hypothetical protein